jgi:DNA topoisomerase I
LVKHLVIVESPAKAGTINKFLGPDYKVEASYGHVRDLPKSKMGVDIEKNFEPHYIIPTKAKKVVNKLKKQVKTMETIFLAPDPDREGEAISWHLAQILSNGKAVIKRVAFNELTRDAIREAFKNPRELNVNLFDSQQARRILDRIVGYELSPLLWKKVGRGLSAGRVQSVALRLIVEREDEIRKFKPKEYWTIEAKLSSKRPEEEKRVFKAKLDRIGKEKIEVGDQKRAHQLKEYLEKQDFKVLSVQKKQRKRRPQAPFTTSKLQQEGYNRLGFSAAKTMRTAQGLYEGVAMGKEGSVGLITYMRTDSVNVSVTARKEAVKFIKEKFGTDHLPKTPNLYKSRKGAQEAHEAIRPSSAYREPDQIKDYLSEDQFKLYDLIWRKFVASQMTSALDLVTSIDIEAGENHFFRASGTRNIFPGYLAVLSDAKRMSKKGQEEKQEDESNQDFPALEENELLKLHELLADQHFTKPPGRYNDASLVKVLEEKGIGRPSTYSPIIFTLINRDYVSRKGGALVPTDVAETVIALLVEHFPSVLDVKFTALMEEELDKIEEGEADWVKVLKDFYESFGKRVLDAKEKMKDMKPEVISTGEDCEKCGKPLVVKWGRFGRFVACSGFPECRNTKPLSTGVSCQKAGCDGYLVKRKGRRGQYFYGCSKYPNCDFIVNKLPEKNSEKESNASLEETPQTDLKTIPEAPQEDPKTDEKA